MERKMLKFSEPFVKVQYLENVTDYNIKARTILLNISEKPVLIDGMTLKPWHSSIYQEVFMSPGYTHEPFYNDKGKYPWHAYYADTDCIWLAIEGAPSKVD
jgi:hypothetical protein